MYLTTRTNSQHWLLDLTFPATMDLDRFLTEDELRLFAGGRRHFTKSMRTIDFDEAVIRSNPYVQAYRLIMYRWRNRHRIFDSLADRTGATPMPFKSVAGLTYDDGLQIIDGMQAVVAGAKITFYGADGKLLRLAENPAAHRIQAPYVDNPETAAAVLAKDPLAVVPRRFERKIKTGDHAIIDAYCAGKKPPIEADIRHSWSIYQEAVGVPFAKATRMDARRFAEALDARGLGIATIQKKVGWLSSAVSHASKLDLFTGRNPFAQVMLNGLGKPAERREEISEEQMATVWANLHQLDDADQVLWRLLAKTGARLSEACSIAKEEFERGSDRRFCWVGTKTQASWRRLPLLAGIGLPDKIAGRLFDDARKADKRLNRFLEKVLPGSGVTVHALRHRAIDVWRHSQVNSHIQRRVAGHASRDVNDAYGGQHPPLSLVQPLIEMNAIDGTFQLASEAA